MQSEYVTHEEIVKRIMSGNQLILVGVDLYYLDPQQGERGKFRIHTVENMVSLEYGDDVCASIEATFDHEYLKGTMRLAINKLIETVDFDFSKLTISATGKALGFYGDIAPQLLIANTRRFHDYYSEPEVFEEGPKKRHEPFLRDRYGRILGRHGKHR